MTRPERLWTTFVLPTFKEADNISMIVSAFVAALETRAKNGVYHFAQLLFIDDSPDLDTVQMIEKMAEWVKGNTPVVTVKCIRRENGNGLAGAMALGEELARWPVVVHLDTDGQHSPEDAVAAAERLHANPELDAVLATRYADGGSAPGFTPLRLFISLASGWFARLMLPRRLAGVTDPGSGFFAIRKDAVKLDAVNITGWKFLLSVLVACWPLRFEEMGYTFGARAGGESKATMSQGLKFIRQVLSLTAAFRWFDRQAKPVQFGLTGLAGWALQTTILVVAISLLDWSVWLGTAVSVAAAFAFNIALNASTFRDRGLDKACAVKALMCRTVTAVGQTVAVPMLVALHHPVVPFTHIRVPSISYFWASNAAVGAGMVLNYLASSAWAFQPGWMRVRFGNPDRPQVTAMPRVPAASRGDSAHDAPTMIMAPVPSGVRGPFEAASKVIPEFSRARVRKVRRLRGPLRAAINWTLAIGLALVIGFGCTHGVRTTLIALVTITTLPSFVIGIRTNVLSSYFYKTPWEADPSRDEVKTYEEPYYDFSLLVAAREEEGVIARNIRRMMMDLKYAAHMYKVLVGISDHPDDRTTMAEAIAAAAEFGGRIRIVAIPAFDGEGNDIRSKAHTINVLVQEHVDTDLVFWLDSESRGADGIMHEFNTRLLRNPQVAVLVGGVQLVNVHAPARTVKSRFGRRNPLYWLMWPWRRLLGLRWGSAWRGLNCNEYYLWFRSRMRYQQKVGFFPVPGNTVCVWTHIVKKFPLRDLWTEDADWGARLSVEGLTIQHFWVRSAITEEETPGNLFGHNRQRVRWTGGFIQIKHLGDYLHIKSIRSRLQAWELLSLPFWQAISGLMVPVSLLGVFLFKTPVGIVQWSALPAAVTLWNAWIQCVAFRDMTRDFGLKVTRGYMIRFILFLPLYQMALSLAALRAQKRWSLRHVLADQLAWGKTKHSREVLDVSTESAAA